MLDTNMIDVLLDEPALLSRLRVFAHEKPIGLLMTHLQVDEINEMGEAKRARKDGLIEVLNQLEIDLVSTYGFVLGRSRLDNAIPASERHSEILRAMTKGNARHNEDAIIVLTAAWLYADIVSKDITDVPRMASMVGVRHFSPQAFANFLESA